MPKKRSIQVGYWPAPEVMMSIAYQDAHWLVGKFAEGNPADEIKIPRRALWAWMAAFKCWAEREEKESL